MVKGVKEAEVKKPEKERNGFHEPIEVPVIKHPLESTWTLWYFDMDKNKSWEESQKIVGNFNTIEDFWCLFHHIKKASDLRQGCDYSMFKEGIRPMWEDDANKCGGRWVLSLDKRQRMSLDYYWLELLLSMIGEGYHDNSKEICGSVVNVRPRGDKIALWTKDCNAQADVLAIGRVVKQRLNLSPRSMIVYQVHKDTMLKSGSTTKNTYTL